MIFRDRLVYIVDPANPRLRDGRVASPRGPRPRCRTRPPVRACRHLVNRALDGLGVTPHVVVTTGGWLPLPSWWPGPTSWRRCPSGWPARCAAAAGLAVEPPFGTLELVEAAWWHPMHAADPALTWLRTILTEIT